MENDKNLINLKEAAEISGYSADYIGQLIRQGKIPGKQVYTNIAWMTTAEAVLAYKNKGQQNQDKKTVKDQIVRQSRLFNMQINLLKLIFKSFKQAIPMMVFILVIFLALVFSLIYAFIAPDKVDNGINVDIKTEEIRY
ncbi:MAG: hypothetical protein U9R06_00610 [Patescibacteria group bacterium]|nr:hypothetical protein [Patescibacteria group bacterium]